MLAIPLPFVVSLLLLVLAGSLWGQRRQSALWACLFLLLCAATTAVVGLRWTFDVAFLRMLQPVLACLIPVVAWWVFCQAKTLQRPTWLHLIVPLLITFASITYPFWEPPIDVLITLQYLIYCVMLWHSAGNKQSSPEFIRLSDWEWAIRAERMAACMLLFSACIDGALTIDFMWAEGEHAMWILSLGHALLLPTLAIAVMGLALMTTPEPSAQEPAVGDVNDVAKIQVAEVPPATLTDANDEWVMQQVVALVTGQTLYLDPDLTLARIARKAGIPARQISAAVNRVTGQNISQWINQYRIEYATQRLANSDDAITQIYLDSGFQTKSNFHREFSRIIGMSPSQYRQSLG